MFSGGLFMEMETTKHTQQIHNFCLNKKDVEEIHTKYNDFFQPFPCYIADRYEHEYLLVELDVFDYAVIYCYKMPIEDIMDIDQEEEDYLLQRLKPKVIKITKRDITLSINDKIVKLRIRDYYSY